MLYGLNGEKIGEGVPAPSQIGFSLCGYDPNYGPNCWIEWRLNAEMWFEKWCDKTVSISAPSPQTISSYVRNNKVRYFYELAHGSYYAFQADREGSFYTADMCHNDMQDRSPIKFAFIGSCEGM